MSKDIYDMKINRERQYFYDALKQVNNKFKMPTFYKKILMFYLHRLRLIGLSNSSWDRFFDWIPPHSAINQTDAQNLPSLERWWLAAGGWF
ncbi:hypothetical protein T07_5954 [Trichinella nelsoni]|uniref:Uncharacterized protein n=1 Tax=Trichinella nelsoni TaxID=6336 RepID=A0A0V0RTK8_9BILA|nr:hypothetical protein T07_5954 [Trichinella nelsoni]